MFKHYAGCDLNVTFISLTVVACLLVTVLSGQSRLAFFLVRCLNVMELSPSLPSL